MRTVTLEFDSEHLVLLGLIPSGFFDRYQELELLQTLRLERGWRLQLVRLRHRGPLKTAAELERESRRISLLYGLESFELVERRPRTRDYVLLIRQRNPAWLRRVLTLAGRKISPTAPFHVDAEKTVATFHGEERVLRRVLNRLKKEEIPFRVLRAASHPVMNDDGSTELTVRQRGVIARAWALGYYAVPRRITLSHLARVTGQSPPALGKMLRRAEGHLVVRFLAESAGPATEAEAAAE